MIDRPKLTARQQQILDLIQSAIARTGAPPTRAEIANEQTGLRAAMGGFRSKGFFERLAKIGRTLTFRKSADEAENAAS